MNNVFDYLPPIVTFVAMFIGMLGASQLQDKTGLRAITPVGWILCAIAAFSLLIAIYSQYKKDADLAVMTESRQRMQSVVILELQQGVESMKDVLRYAALMPHLTTATMDGSAIQYSVYTQSHIARNIDLRSAEVVQNLHLSELLKPR